MFTMNMLAKNEYIVHYFNQQIFLVTNHYKYCFTTDNWETNNNGITPCEPYRS